MRTTRFADGPWICAFHEFAALDNAFILAYPFYIFFFCGWGWGSALIWVFGAVSYYICWCLAGVRPCTLYTSRLSVPPSPRHAHICSAPITCAQTAAHWLGSATCSTAA